MCGSGARRISSSGRIGVSGSATTFTPALPTITLSSACEPRGSTTRTRPRSGPSPMRLLSGRIPSSTFLPGGTSAGARSSKPSPAATPFFVVHGRKFIGGEPMMAGALTG